MKISLLENKRIMAELNGKTIFTDQPTKSDGLGQYLSPFDVFKASIGCCMGYYVRSFCVKNDIPLDSVWLEVNFVEDDVVQDINVKIIVDERFPTKYTQAVIKSAEACKVKKQIKYAPNFNINVEKMA